MLGRTMPAGSTGILAALGAALLFGLSTPAAKALVGAVDPWLLAGLLYFGSGLGLGAYLIVRRVVGARNAETPPSRQDFPRLAGATLAGGVVGPLLLMFALETGPASQSALLLNLEGVFTVLLAWMAFGEHVSPRIAAGLAAITAGGVTLAWTTSVGFRFDRSAVLVAGASLAWAIDNNLTRKLAARDPVYIAAVKCLTAGVVNIGIASVAGVAWPAGLIAVLAGIVGLLGYGTSLVLFVVGLRHVGTARTVAYFSTAPFIGASMGVVALGEPLTVQLLLAAVLMAVGAALVISERHAHEHVHETLEHDHPHDHDAHHQHEHPDGEATGPHAHRHVHSALQHSHAHYPDLHHRHPH